MKSLKFSTKKVLQLILLKIIDSDTYPAATIRDKIMDLGLNIPKGTIYSALSDLRRIGVVTYGLEELDFGALNKCYSLTKSGNKLLQILLKDWADLTRIIKSLI